MGGMYISAGAEFALGKRDKPVRMTTKGYVPLLQAISQKYVLFWDDADKRGWLTNGLSALLHIFRGSLEHDRTSKFSSALQMNPGDIQEPSGAYSPASAVDILTNEQNKSLPLFSDRDGTFYRLQDRVENLCNIMEKLFDQQEDVDKPAGVRLSFRPRANLEGWDFKDIVAAKNPLFPRAATLGTTGKGWVDFTRELRVVTIMGRGFGELIEPRPQPGSKASCPRWARLPTNRFYLAVHAADLQDIMDSEGDSAARPRRLCQNIFWYSSGRPLQLCPCTSSPPVSPMEGHHDPVQALFSSTFKRFGALRSREPVQLTADGAVVFGHSTKIGWYYNDEGDPVQGDPGSFLRSPLPFLSSKVSGSSSESTRMAISGRQASDYSGSSQPESSQLHRNLPSTPGTSVSNDSGGNSANMASSETGGRVARLWSLSLFSGFKFTRLRRTTEIAKRGWQL